MRIIFEEDVCVVTGAGGGIGRELAIGLAKNGALLAISDINEAGLEETAAEVRKHTSNIHVAKLNVADRGAIYDYRRDVVSHFGAVHQLYNNAGVSGMGGLNEMSDEAIQRVIDINLMGVLHGSRAFMPDLIKSGDGKLINISSLNGYAGMPGLAIYCTTKFGVRGLTEALRADALFHNHPVQIVCVHPGGIKTNIARANLEHIDDVPKDRLKLRMKQLDLYETKLLTYPAEKAASDILNGVAKGRHRIVITPEAKRLDFITRLMPENYLNLINKHMKRELA